MRCECVYVGMGMHMCGVSKCLFLAREVAA
jgi:hypothetical protein